MLGQWCAAGLQYADFWPLTMAEILIVLEGDRKRRLRDHDDARARAHELAVLISYAHHQPGKIPKFTPTDDPGKPKSDAAAQAQVRGYFIGLALNSKPKK